MMINKLLPKVDPTNYDPDGDILILEAFLNNEPPTPIPNQGDCSPETQEEIKLCEAKTVKSSIDEPPKDTFHSVYGSNAERLAGKEETSTIVSFDGFSGLMKVGTGHVPKVMLAIFHDMVEKTMEVFMDDFSVFGNSFENCLSHLEKMLQRCEDTNLCLNWEKSHFMVKEGIVLGHKF
ncbi:reverse transcriptase domain-containing protein [Tanacetum coccineum]